MVLVGVGGSEIIGVFQQRLTSGLGEAGHDAGVLCARRHRRAKRGASGEAKPLTEDDDEEEDEEEEEEGGLPMVGTAAEVCLTAMEKRQMLCGNEREVRRLLEDSLMVPKKHCMMGFVCQCGNLLHGRTTRELQVGGDPGDGR